MHFKDKKLHSLQAVPYSDSSLARVSRPINYAKKGCLQYKNFKVIPFLGGFYSDDVGYAARSCKKCPNGSFVQYEKTPGTRYQDCKTCPEGNS